MSNWKDGPQKELPDGLQRIKKVIVVKSHYYLNDPPLVAMMVADAMRMFGINAEAVVIMGRDGWRVVHENEKEVLIQDFYRGGSETA